MAAFLLVVMIFHATPALAEENFGVGADVEIEVERATQEQIEIGAEPSLQVYIIVGFAFGLIVLLLFVRFKTRRVTATTGALQRGEKLG